MAAKRAVVSLNDAYTANNYHAIDEVTPDWDMTGGAQDLELLFTVGRGLADGNLAANGETTLNSRSSLRCGTGC